MAKEFELTEEMKSRIGSESPPWTYEVTTTSVRAFARGVGYTDPVYFDLEAARAAGYPSLPAPPCYLGTPVFIPGVSSDTFSGPVDGYPRVEHGLTGLLDGGTRHRGAVRLAETIPALEARVLMRTAQMLERRVVQEEAETGGQAHPLFDRGLEILLGVERLRIGEASDLRSLEGAN